MTKKHAKLPSVQRVKNNHSLGCLKLGVDGGGYYVEVKFKVKQYFGNQNSDCFRGGDCFLVLTIYENSLLYPEYRIGHFISTVSSRSFFLDKIFKKDLTDFAQDMSKVKCDHLV